MAALPTKNIKKIHFGLCLIQFNFIYTASGTVEIVLRGFVPEQATVAGKAYF